jgi:type I restriction enzyme S subunit
MKKYDNYKDSGIEWIGEIPEHWNVQQLKINTKIKTGYTPLTSDENNFSNEGTIWVKPDNLKLFEPIIDSKEKVSALGVKQQNIIQKGSVLLCCIGTIGKFGVAGVDLLTNQQINSITFKDKLTNEYGKYLVFSFEDELNSWANGNVVRILNTTSLGNIKTPIPSEEEQTAIANYLDQKTTQIDQLINQKKRFIELLQEERTAVINQAVTKGLDPTVKMKDSGIEWLGEIPEHWEVKKLKYFADVVLGKMLTSDDKGNYHLRKYLRAKNIEWNKPNVDDVKEMWFSDNELKNFKVKKNDLLVSEGGEVGRTCIWNGELEECYIQNSVHKVTILNNGDSNYFLNQFVLLGKLGHFDAIVNRISIAHLTKEKLKDVSFFYPTIKEQKEISIHIETKTSEIDTIISKSQQEIELLREYKTALISEVVTGKVDVRNVVLN